MNYFGYPGRVHDYNIFKIENTPALYPEYFKLPQQPCN